VDNGKIGDLEELLFHYQGGNSPNSNKVLSNVSRYVSKSRVWSNFSAKQRFVACWETIDEYQLSKQRFRCLDQGRASGKSFLYSFIDLLRIESKQRLVNSSPGTPSSEPLHPHWHHAQPRTHLRVKAKPLTAREGEEDSGTTIFTNLSPILSINYLSLLSTFIRGPYQREHIGIERWLGARSRQSRTERARQLTSTSPAATSNPRGGKKRKQSLNKK
jgi:hypothetical protein